MSPKCARWRQGQKHFCERFCAWPPSRAAGAGLAKKIGELSANAGADLIAIPFAGKPADIYEAVLAHSGNVTASLIEGRWAVPPPDL